jgi:hypothetical protein
MKLMEITEVPTYDVLCVGCLRTSKVLGKSKKNCLSIFKAQRLTFLSQGLLKHTTSSQIQSEETYFKC